METATEAKLIPVSTSIKRTEITVYIFTGILMAFLLLFRLGVYPSGWLEEGQVVNITKDESAYLMLVENFAENGVYAERTEDGDNYIGAVISAGPTVILPATLVWAVSGDKVRMLRLVTVLYGFLTYAALYGMARVFGNKRFAYLVMLLALFNISNLMPYIFRNVMADGAGMFFVFAGLWLWLRPGERTLIELVMVGLMMGLGSLSKNQYAIFILPGLFLAWMLDIFWYKQRGWKFFVIPGAVAGLLFIPWTYFVFYLVGSASRDVSADLEVLRNAGNHAYFLLSPGINVINLSQLSFAQGYLGLLLPAVVYGMFLSLPRTRQAQNWGIVTVFMLLAMVFFVFSIGWMRTSVPIKFLGALFVVRFAQTLTNGFQFEWAALWATLRLRQEPTQSLLLQTMVLVMLLGMAVLPLVMGVYYVAAAGNYTPYAVADYLEEEVPPDAVIETWDKELIVLTDTQIRIPPQSLDAQVFASQQLGEEEPHHIYDFRKSTHDYLVVGPFTRFSDAYPKEWLEEYEEIRRIGDYTIYRRTKGLVG